MGNKKRLVYTLDRIKLCDALCERVGLSRYRSRKFLDAVIDIITTHIRNGDSVELRGLGRFYMKYRRSKKARNIKRDEFVMIESHYEPSFKFSGSLRRSSRMSVLGYENRLRRRLGDSV